MIFFLLVSIEFLLRSIFFRLREYLFAASLIAFFDRAIAFSREAIAFLCEVIYFDPMPDSSPSAPARASGTPEAPALPFVPLTKALGEPLRWAILGELATGERLMVVEIAERVGRPATLVSKHLAVLRQLGLVAIKQRLYSLSPGFLVDGERRELDLGYAVLRLDRLP